MSENETKKCDEMPLLPKELELPPASDSKPEAIKKEMSTKEAYFASLDAWVKNANISQNAMALFPWYLLSSYPQIFQNQAAGMSSPLAAQSFQTAQLPANFNVNPNANIAAAGVAAPAQPAGTVLFSFRILDDRSQAELINRNGGYEYVIAPFWKRAVAEIIDMLILLLLKVVLTFTVMNIFDLDLGFDLDKEVLRKAYDDDDYTGFLAISMEFLAFSSDLLLLELFTKVIVCCYEALWTSFYNGATPGKALMNLRIHHVEAVLPILPLVPPPAPMQQPQLGFPSQRPPIRALIFPAETPGLARSFMRAVAKNLIMTLLFPMCFIMIFFKNNRTAYDVLTKTIVVENQARPVIRHQR